MALLRKWNYDGAVMGIWHVTETSDELKAMLADSSYIDEELEKYKSESRKMEFLAVRVLLREITGEVYRVLHYPSGKPFIKDSEMKISISHTRGYVAVAIHPCNEIGIDIEYFSDRVRKVVSRFVRDDEMDYICSNNLDLNSPQKYVYMLLLLWSGKETLYKIIDSEEVDFKKHLCVNPFNIDIKNCHDFIGTGKMEAREFKSQNQSVFMMDYILHRDFVCTYSVAD